MPRGEFFQEFGSEPYGIGGTPTSQPPITEGDVTYYTMLPKEKGGWEAGDVEWMIKNGLLDPATATRGLVEADRMRHAARGGANVTPMRGFANPYGAAGWGAPDTPAQQPYQAQNPYRFTPLQGLDWSTALRNFDIPDVTWASFPEQKRDPMQSWLRASGYNPGGSLGQYGMRSWTTQGAGLNKGLFESIPDEGLRKWALAMFNLGPAPT